jgi:hypothetical protein
MGNVHILLPMDSGYVIHQDPILDMGIYGDINRIWCILDGISVGNL